MKEIEITMEKIIRATCQFDVSDSVYDEIKTTFDYGDKKYD